MHIVQHSPTCACICIISWAVSVACSLDSWLFVAFMYIFFFGFFSEFSTNQFYCCNFIPQNSAKLTTTINIIVKCNWKGGVCVWVKTQKCRSNNTKLLWKKRGAYVNNKTATNVAVTLNNIEYWQGIRNAHTHEFDDKNAIKFSCHTVWARCAPV